MLIRLAVAALAVLGLGAQSPLPPEQASVDATRLIRCGRMTGSAWRAPGNRYITAHHVNSMGECSIDDVPLSVESFDGVLDFAILRGDAGGREYRIDCGGFRTNEVYRAIGWANGVDLVAVRVVGTGERGDPFGSPDFSTLYRLRGGVARGMSGGPIASREGAVVGIIVATFGNGSLARPLSETSLCNGRI